MHCSACSTPGIIRKLLILCFTEQQKQIYFSDIYSQDNSLVELVHIKKLIAKGLVCLCQPPLLIDSKCNRYLIYNYDKWADKGDDATFVWSCLASPISMKKKNKCLHISAWDDVQEACLMNVLTFQRLDVMGHVWVGEHFFFCWFSFIHSCQPPIFTIFSCSGGVFYFENPPTMQSVQEVAVSCNLVSAEWCGF